MFQESLLSCQARQATANPMFEFGNASPHIRGITHNLIEVRARHAILRGMNAMTRSKRRMAGLTCHQEEAFSGAIGSCCCLICLSRELS